MLPTITTTSVTDRLCGRESIEHFGEIIKNSAVSQYWQTKKERKKKKAHSTAWREQNSAGFSSSSCCLVNSPSFFSHLHCGLLAAKIEMAATSHSTHVYALLPKATSHSWDSQKQAPSHGHHHHHHDRIFGVAAKGVPSTYWLTPTWNAHGGPGIGRAGLRLFQNSRGVRWGACFGESWDDGGGVCV